jgi:DNA-binding winged helix-turn-helix (wHTH) protein
MKSVFAVNRQSFEQPLYRLSVLPLGAAMSDPCAGQLRFGSFVLDLRRGELLHGARHVPLRRQAFDTLHHLTEHNGRIVSKAELVQAVWASPPADPDASVVQCIKEIRKALGAEGRWMIRTVAGAGYEFKAEVITLRPAAGTRQADSEASSSRRDMLIGWIARRPVLASGVALTAGAVLSGALVLVWSIVSSMSQRDANVSAFAVTCSQGKSACMRTGGDEETCEGRRQSCVATGCWNGALVQRCGYERK